MDRKVLEKIKKCLALSQSSEAHEAAAAMRQAQKLMEHHGISERDLALDDVGTFQARAGAGKTPPVHVASLATMVARAFGAELVYSARYRRGRWMGVVEFYGVNGSADVAGYAFDVLGRRLRSDRSAYLASLNKRLKRATKVRRGDLYAQAWVEAVARTVTPQRRTTAENAIIEAYAAERWSEGLKDCQTRDNSKGARWHDASALREGYADGREVDFHQGVSSAGQSQAVIGRHQGVS